MSKFETACRRSVRAFALGYLGYLATISAATIAYAQTTRESGPTAQLAVDGGRPDNVTTLVGRVIYDGPRPQPAKIALPENDQVEDGAGRSMIESDLDVYRKLGLVDESLIVGDDGGLANVILWARTKDIPVAPFNGPLPAATIRVKDGRFDPHVLAFWRAAPMRWENKEMYGVNFKLDSMNSRANVIVDAGESHEIQLERSETYPAHLTCSIHPWLHAYVLPLDHTYYSVTGREGQFEIKNLPLGEWEFGIWQEKGGWLRTDKYPTARFTLTITAGKNDLADLHVDPQRMAAERPTAVPRRGR